MKLYSVSTIVKEYRGHSDVVFTWFRDQPDDLRPYMELIEDYDPDNRARAYPECAIDEYFTENEATALKAYLDRSYPESVTTIDEVKLPIPWNSIDYRAIPVGGGTGFLELWERPSYALPFRVCGYFDLRACTAVDEPDRSGDVQRRRDEQGRGDGLRRWEMLAASGDRFRRDDGSMTRSKLIARLDYIRSDFPAYKPPPADAPAERHARYAVGRLLAGLAAALSALPVREDEKEPDDGQKVVGNAWLKL